MEWSYSGDPAQSELDRVRFEVGDTDESEKLLSDSEVRFAIDTESNLLAAAAKCCEVIARKFSREANIRLGPQYIYLGERSAAFAARAKELRAKCPGGLPAIEGEHKLPRGLMDNWE